MISCLSRGTVLYCFLCYSQETLLVHKDLMHTTQFDDLIVDLRSEGTLFMRLTLIVVKFELSDVLLPVLLPPPMYPIPQVVGLHYHLYTCVVFQVQFLLSSWIFHLSLEA